MSQSQSQNLNHNLDPGTHCNQEVESCIVKMVQAPKSQAVDVGSPVDGGQHTAVEPAQAIRKQRPHVLVDGQDHLRRRRLVHPQWARPK